MKRFSTFTEESNRELARQAYGYADTFKMIFDSVQEYPSNPFSVGYWGFPLLIDSTTQKMLTGEVSQVNLHITNPGSIYRGNLFKRQGKKSSISTTRYVPPVYHMLSGIEKLGGVVVLLKGNVLIAAGDDLYTRTDGSGRRWIATVSGFNSFHRGSADWQAGSRVVTPILRQIGLDIDKQLRPKVDQAVNKIKRRLDQMVARFRNFDELRNIVNDERESRGKPRVEFTEDEMRKWFEDFYDGHGSLSYIFDEYTASKAGSTMYAKFYQIMYYFQRYDKAEIYSMNTIDRQFLQSDPKLIPDIKKMKHDLIKYYIDMHRRVWKKYANQMRAAMGDQLTPIESPESNKQNFTEHVMNKLEILEVHFVEGGDDSIVVNGKPMSIEELAEYVKKTHGVKVVLNSNRDKIIKAVKSLRAKYERTT